MFKKIVQGFLLGLGFSIAFVLVLIAAQYLYTKYVFEDQVREATFGSNWKEYSEDAGLVITEHNPIYTENSVEFIGVVANNGTDTWDSISIEIELFDKDGKFMDECSEYISSPLSPSESENFKASCGGCEKRPIADFDHYEIHIVDAIYERPRDGT